MVNIHRRLVGQRYVGNWGVISMDVFHLACNIYHLNQLLERKQV